MFSGFGSFFDEFLIALFRKRLITIGRGRLGHVLETFHLGQLLFVFTLFSFQYFLLSSRLEIFKLLGTILYNEDEK
jgi:hypothetical protein